MAPKNADQNPPTVNPFTQVATSQKRSALITNTNIPSVRIVAGSVSSTRIGRISAFTSASTAAATTAVQKLSTCTEGTTYGSASNASALISQTRSRLRTIRCARFYDASAFCAFGFRPGAAGGT